jgi:dinuclear metal center YbgI/SA1388 family protein
LIGNSQSEVDKALITLDVTNEVIDEAVLNNCNLIIAHHPIIFKGIKKLRGDNLVEQVVIKAIKNDIAIYAIHTNLDNVWQGVNNKLAEKLELHKLQILQPGKSELKKLVTFCPLDHVEKVRIAMFKAGAGHIGKYSDCSFNTAGTGSFRALEGSNPFVGEQGKVHLEEEIRIETIVADNLLSAVIKAMTDAHPYEEVAYDIYPLNNTNPHVGAGMIGSLNKEEEVRVFLKKVKQTLGIAQLRHNFLIQKKVNKVAICGGSGGFLIHAAYRAGADIFITGDVKYHDFFDYEGEMTIVDAGHFETEQFTKDLLYDILKQKFPNFSLKISRIDTNPVSFL